MVKVQKVTLSLLIRITLHFCDIIFTICVTTTCLYAKKCCFSGKENLPKYYSATLIGAWKSMIATICNHKYQHGVLKSFRLIGQQQRIVISGDNCRSRAHIKWNPPSPRSIYENHFFTSQLHLGSHPPLKPPSFPLFAHTGGKHSLISVHLIDSISSVSIAHCLQHLMLTFQHPHRYRASSIQSEWLIMIELSGDSALWLLLISLSLCVGSAWG